MNKKQILADLADIANNLDAKGAHSSASALTDVMRRVSQSTPWWQNDAGEPIYSPEAIRAEESAGSNYGGYDYDSADFNNYQDSLDDDWAERQSERFADVYENWIAHQDLPILERKVLDDEKNKHMQRGLEHLKKYRNRPNFDGEEEWMKRLERQMPTYVDLKDMLEQYILGTPQSSHQKTWWDDIDTMHNVLDAAKSAILNGTDIMDAINSVPAEGQKEKRYEGPEDFSWDGGRED